MTPEYAIQWPIVDGLLPDFCGLVPKWTHSILNEPDFCSEWEAAHRASELALQCQQPTHSKCVPNDLPSRKRAGRASVSFEPWVEVFLGDGNSLSMYHTPVHLDVICDMEKPWSCRRTCVADPEPLATFHYQRDLSVPVCQLFEGFVGFVGFAAQPPVRYPCDVPLCDPLSPSEAVSIQRSLHPDVLQRVFHGSQPSSGFQVSSDCKCSVPSSEPAHLQCLLSFDGLWSEEPTSLAVAGVFDTAPSFTQPFVRDLTGLLSEVCVPFSVSGANASAGPAASIACPAGDNSASASDHPMGSHDQNAIESSSPSGRAGSPIRLPPFAQQMMINLPIEFLSNPVRIVQGVLVRTWYLHHVNIPRSLQARQVMLTGPPHLWRPQILTVWADFLIPGEDLTLDLVNPNPPRNWHETSILFDLILAQGLYTGRFSGLTTISPTITDPTLRMYAVAVSFAPDISGQDVVTMTDVQPLCNRFECLVFHARAQLYLDFNPVHRMHGDSFVIYLSQRTAFDGPVGGPVGGPVVVSDPAPEPDFLMCQLALQPVARIMCLLQRLPTFMPFAHLGLGTLASFTSLARCIAGSRFGPGRFGRSSSSTCQACWRSCS